MSTGPSCSTTSATSRSRSAGLLRSTPTPIAVPPAALMAATVSGTVPANCEDPSDMVRAATATAAPASANRCAIWAPMPRLPPVTMATLPSSCPTVDSSTSVRMNDRSLGRREQAVGDRPDLVPKLGRLLDDERPAEPGQHVGRAGEPLGPEGEPHAALHLLERAQRDRDPAPRARQVGVEDDRDSVRPRDGG